jgi:hypothetical protein
LEGQRRASVTHLRPLRSWSPISPPGPADRARLSGSPPRGPLAARPRRGADAARREAVDGRYSAPVGRMHSCASCHARYCGPTWTLAKMMFPSIPPRPGAVRARGSTTPWRSKAHRCRRCKTWSGGTSRAFSRRRAGTSGAPPASLASAAGRCRVVCESTAYLRAPRRRTENGPRRHRRAQLACLVPSSIARGRAFVCAAVAQQRVAPVTVQPVAALICGANISI